VVLMALSSAMFLSLVEVALAGGDATACAEPSIPLRLDAAVFLVDLVRRVHKTPIWSLRSVFEILFDISTQCF
jgi:hypothetical protein